MIWPPSTAQQVFDASHGANEARNAAYSLNAISVLYSGLEMMVFQDNSALIFIGYNQGVFVSKGA